MNLNTHSIESSSLIIWFSGKLSAVTTGEKEEMKKLVRMLGVLKNTSGQDLIEYALMAGFVAVAAGAVMPGVADSISTIFSKVGSVMAIASTQGS